jgi:TolB protein
MKKTACLILCLILPLLCLSRPAAGKVYIDILSPAFQKFPVAIPDFAPLPGSEAAGALATEIPGKLSAALELTGFFRVVDRKAYLESPGTPEGEIRFSDWRAVGSEYLVKGGFEENGETLSLEFRLYDVVEGMLLTGKRYTGKRMDEKAMVYRMAGEILQTLTGDEGVFNTEIVFTGKKDRFSDLYAVQFDGSDFRRLTNRKTITLLPRWSGDGSKIAYTDYTRGNPDLYVLNLGTGMSKCIASKGGLNVSGGWSPDGRKMLVVSSREGNEEIYVLDLETGNSTRLTNDPAIDVSPSWSPDGKKIAFVSSRSGSPQIFLMEADGSGVRRLTFEGNYNSSPSWSPSGMKIAYEGRTGGQFQIFTIDETGRNNLQLTYENGGAESPSWSPDGRFIAFQGRRNGRGSIAVINANGLNLRVLYGGKDLDASSPAWSPRLNLY